MFWGLVSTARHAGEDLPVAVALFADFGALWHRLMAAPDMVLAFTGALLTAVVEAAAGDPSHNEKWQHGWAEGYMDGFREVTLNRR